jgi:serine/threonine protein phosphatase 1
MARPLRLPTTARGERIYAIGDVHGRLDLFVRLVALIRQDAETRPPPRRTRILLIGDLIDRGPSSAELVERLRTLQAGGMDIVVLKGNHELMMVAALRGDLYALEDWLRFGGDETLRSCGLSDDTFALPLSDLLAAAGDAVPTAAIDWLDALPLTARSGDYVFVHAGIRPGVPLKRQQPGDLLWIADEFLDHEAAHPAMIVHGHTIVEDGPHLLANRIAIDTGAYRTGRLSAVALEEDRQWTITT